MSLAPRSTAAFDALLQTLADLRDDYVLSTDRHQDELEALEGFTYLLQLVSLTSELIVEGDPERPRFSSIVSPARKFQGDNPDSLYQQALIRGDRAYRITGRKDLQDYISFTVHAPAPDGGYAGAVQSDINDTDLDINPDGMFELILTPKDRGGPGVQLEPDARIVIVRNYYQRERSAQNDPDVSVTLHIEPLDDPGPAPAVDDASLAERLSDASALIRAVTTGMRALGSESNVPFVSNTPNTVGTPWSFRNAAVATAGAVDIFYSSGTFELGPDDALVMEGAIPRSRFTNVMLWNAHMQTLDYSTRRSSLNAAQMDLGEEGSYRIVISAQDPGVANWLDTGGHRRGTIFWRFLLPELDPETPRCTVVPVSSLRG
jgi:hypothetical protein